MYTFCSTESQIGFCILLLVSLYSTYLYMGQMHKLGGGGRVIFLYFLAYNLINLIAPENRTFNPFP